MKTLETATYPELMRFAKENDLDVTYSVTKADEVRSKIRAAFGEVEIPSSDAPAVENKPSPIIDAGYRSDPKVIVNISSDDANGGKRHYPICVNGDQILVKRDTDVAIPYRHYIALRNAKETVMSQDFDSAKMKYITVERDQYAVRFNVISMPSQDEIDAFHERTKNIGREPVKAAA